MSFTSGDYDAVHISMELRAIVKVEAPLHLSIHTELMSAGSLKHGPLEQEVQYLSNMIALVLNPLGGGLIRT